MNESTPSVPVKEITTFTIDPNNVKTLYVGDKSIKQILRNPDLVHKIIITNTEPNIPKNVIFDTLFKRAGFNILVPMFLTEEDNKIEFYCMLCGPVLNTFCSQNLLLNIIVNSKKISLPMTLIVAIKKSTDFLTPENFFKLLIQPRVTSSTPVKIDLSKFNTITGMQSKIYLNINYKNCFNFIMNSIQSFSPEIINLSCNDLVTLQGWKNPYPISSIDLSFNKINSTESFKCLFKFNIHLKKINFYENPIWDQFPSSAQCLKELQKLFPNTVIYNQFTQTIESEDNILNSESAIYLIDQFMEHYFSLFENPKKIKCLHEMYHQNAIFSLNNNFKQKNSGLGNGSQFKQQSHNLRRFKSKKYFFIGPDEIINKICNLPQIQHDHCSIQIDILNYIQNKSAAFAMTGVFYEVNRNFVYNFTRSFVIQAGQNGEYHIMNDMFNVAYCRKGILLKNKPLQDISKYLPLPVPVSKEQQDGLVAVFIDITMLHFEHAKNLLEKHNWKFKEALEAFLHDFRFDLIPREHF